MSLKWLTVLVCAAVAFAAALLLATTKRPAFPARASFWETRVHDVGGLAAYEELLALAAAGKAGHQEAHYFGAGIYRALGSASITVCGEELEYGCLHEVFGLVIEHDGLAALRALRDYCEAHDDAFSLCVHGIGHGLVSYFGYEESAMARSLSVCRDVFEPDEAGKCAAGVFMEYLDRTMLAGEGGPFPVSPQEPYAPCYAAPEDDKPHCFSELPRTWRKALWPNGATSSEAVRETERLCAGLGERKFRIACFGGIGSEFFRTTRRIPAQALALCATLAEPEAARVCREQVERMRAVKEANDALPSPRAVSE